MPFFTSYKLTEEQRQEYSAEKLDNFRWISKLLGTYSAHTLTDADLAPESLCLEVAEIGEHRIFIQFYTGFLKAATNKKRITGQFAEVAYSAVPTAFLLENFDRLSQPGYPLEHYHAFNRATSVDSFKGDFAGLPVYLFYRPSTGQLVVSICGTLTALHALQDLRFLKSAHPSGKGYVHSGFWSLYKGIRSKVLNAIRQGIAAHSPTELVLTGHSLGGSICYLLCIDLLADDQNLIPQLKVKLAAFGCPRAGDAALVSHFREQVSTFRERHSHDSFTEYSVKGYNDGVPALPPTRLGYRHFSQEPIYTVGGKLYQIPPTESEHALFRVISDNDNDHTVSLFPKGGHNYYNGRDQEKFVRRINWLSKATTPTQEGWEERYAAISMKHS